MRLRERQTGSALLPTSLRCPRCPAMFSYVQRLSPLSAGENKERIEKAKSLKCGRSSVVERQLPKLYVVGSIPIARSNLQIDGRGSWRSPPSSKTQPADFFCPAG